MWEYFILSMMLSHGPFDATTLSNDQILRTRDSNCSNPNKVLVVQEREGYGMGAHYKWKSGFFISCKELQERYSPVSTEIVEVMNRNTRGQ